MVANLHFYVLFFLLPNLFKYIIFEVVGYENLSADTLFEILS